MFKFVLFLSLLIIGAQCAALPTFPEEFMADNTQIIAMFQGGIKKPDGDVCCTQDAGSQCKVQTQGMQGVTRYDGNNNQTRFDEMGQGIIDNYNIMKEMLVAMNGTDWVCQSYCPIDDGETILNPLNVDPSAKDMGPASVVNKTAELYSWNDSIFKVVKMDENDYYIDISDPKNPLPVRTVMKITPFGGPELAEEWSDYQSYTPGKVDPSYFDVKGIDTCQLDQNCDQDNKFNLNKFRLLGYNFKYHDSFNFVSKINIERQQKKKTQKTVVDADAAKWPTSWTCQEDSTLLMNQYGYTAPDGDICCAASAGGQCAVQYQRQVGTKYYDYDNNRTRFEDSLGNIVVNMFGTVLKSMNVVHNGTHDVCQDYCPIDPEDTLDKGKDYFLPTNVTDKGSTSFEGQTVEDYYWKDTFFGVLTMDYNDMYMDQSTDNYVPVKSIQHLTPFGGPELGQSNTTWSAFKTGTPPASKFDIQGVSTCPMSNQCGQQMFQGARISDKLYRTYLKYSAQL